MQSELFENFIDIIIISKLKIDLHNDYDCIKLEFSEKEKNLLISFFAIKNDSAFPKVVLQFENVTLQNVTFNFEETIRYLTLDTLYRGRFVKNGILEEYSEDGRSYFYLDFYEEFSLEFFSNSIKVLT